MIKRYYFLLFLNFFVMPVTASPMVTMGGTMDVVYHFSYYNKGNGAQTAGFEDYTFAALIPVTGSESMRRRTIHSKATQLWVQSKLNTRLGDVTSYFSMDFQTNATSDVTHTRAGYYQGDTFFNGHHPRLKLAYGQWQGWLIGQNYSTVMNLESRPELNDAGVSIGELYVIQPMIRYTYEDKFGSIQFALEGTDSTIKNYQTADGAALIGDDRKGFPDFIIRMNDKQDTSMSIWLRQLTAGSGSGADERARIGKWVGAASLAGSCRTFKRDRLKYAVHYGALGRYLGLGLFRDGVLTKAGLAGAVNTGVTYPDEGSTIQPLYAVSGYVGYQRWWNRCTRSNIAVSYARHNPVSEEHGSSTDTRYFSMHINFFWAPIEALRVGVEYIHMRHHQAESSLQGHLRRVGLGARWQLM